MTTKTKQAIIITKRELKPQHLSEASRQSLREAAGLLKNRYTDLKRHYHKIRSGWRSYSR